MFGAYVRFRWYYATLRKSSDNQQQHLLLGQWLIIGNMMLSEIWCECDKGGYWTCGIRFSRILESLTA